MHTYKALIANGTVLEQVRSNFGKSFLNAVIAETFLYAADELRAGEETHSPIFKDGNHFATIYVQVHKGSAWGSHRGRNWATVTLVKHEPWNMGIIRRMEIGPEAMQHEA